MNRLLAIGVAAALAANCATGGYRTTAGVSVEPSARSTPAQDPPELTAAYVKALPIGARVKITLTDGKTLKATLMDVRTEAIVVRPRTRVPEPARTIPFSRIASVEMEQPANVGRAIAIGAAVGAGAAIGVFLAILVAFAD